MTVVVVKQLIVMVVVVLVVRMMPMFGKENLNSNGNITASNALQNVCCVDSTTRIEKKSLIYHYSTASSCNVFFSYFFLLFWPIVDRNYGK